MSSILTRSTLVFKSAMFFLRLINSLYWLGSDCTFSIFLWVAKWSKLWGSVEMANVKRIVGVECLLNVSWLGFNAWSGRLRCVWILVWYYAVYIVFFFFFFLTSSLWSDAWHVHLNSTCSHYWYSWDGRSVLSWSVFSVILGILHFYCLDVQGEGLRDILGFWVDFSSYFFWMLSEMNCG